MEPTGPLIRDIWQNDFDAFLGVSSRHDARQLEAKEWLNTIELPNGDTKRSPQF